MNTWLWPDRTIGKRESRELREQHNALVNTCATLLEALEAVNNAIVDGAVGKSTIDTDNDDECFGGLLVIGYLRKAYGAQIKDAISKAKEG